MATPMLNTETVIYLYARMSFNDFTSNFERLEICFLGPDSLTDNEGKGRKGKWEEYLFEGSWRRRVNAGGCRNYPGTITKSLWSGANLSRCR